MAFDKSKDNNPTIGFFNVTPVDANDKEYPGRVKGIPIKGNSAFEKAVIAQAKANPDFEMRAVIRVHILDDTVVSEFVFDSPVAEVTATPVVEQAPATPAAEETIPF